MKKIICVLMSLFVLMSSMAVFASASDSSDTFYFEIDDTEYTVEYVSGDSVSDAKKEFIAAKLVGAEISSPSPANILCDIFGHDYVYGSYDVTVHKVRTSAPRCDKKTYKVTTCEDCDYYQETLTKVAPINCCS